MVGIEFDDRSETQSDDDDEEEVKVGVEFDEEIGEEVACGMSISGDMH